MDYGSRTLQKIMSDTSPNYLRQGIFSLTPFKIKIPYMMPICRLSKTVAYLFLQLGAMRSAMRYLCY